MVLSEAYPENLQVVTDNWPWAAESGCKEPHWDVVSVTVGRDTREPGKTVERQAELMSLEMALLALA